MNDISVELNKLTDALITNEHVSSIGLIALGGSHAYGLATDTSDIDLRGFAIPSKDDILELFDFEQIMLPESDVCVYSLAKACNLLLACNPNMVELLGLHPTSVLITSPIYEELISHKEWFISKQAGSTFGGYASAQLRRIQNAMARDGGTKRITDAAMRSLNAAIDAFPERYPSYQTDSCSLKLDDSDKEHPRILVNLHIDDFPATELRSMTNELDAINKQANNLGKNRRKEDIKLSKHASHLLRLLRMGIEILNDGEVNTYRTTDAQLLLDIKQGKYLYETDDGTRAFAQEFWELIDEAEAKFSEAKETSKLPENGDCNAVKAFIRKHHLNALSR